MSKLIHHTLSQFTLQPNKTYTSFLPVLLFADLTIIVTASAYAIPDLLPQSDSQWILIHLRSLRLTAHSLSQAPSLGLRLQLPRDTLCYSTRMLVHRPMGHTGCVRRFKAIGSSIVSLDRTLTLEALSGPLQSLLYVNRDSDQSFY